MSVARNWMTALAQDLPAQMPAHSPAAPLTGSFPLVELRQYTLHEGARDELVDLFEREFIESQEAEGMKVIGTFRDLDRPNRFVWLRGFSGMDARASGLRAFYEGPVWKAHREAANATMVDSDDVLLLRAPKSAAQFHLSVPRPAPGEEASAGLIVATILYLSGDAAEAADLFSSEMVPELSQAGVPPLAWFVSEAHPNNYPRLPVREGEKVLVWFAAFPTVAAYEARMPMISFASIRLAGFLDRAPEVLRLEPTARSQLRGPAPRGTEHDFDFLIGNWAVTHRKLARRGVGSSDWRTYAGKAQTRSLLDGLCNVEEHRIPHSGFSGVALRCFDKAAQCWAIYWIDERDGRLQPPVYGGFRGDEGTFEGADCDGGRLVDVRFRWRRLSSNSARWEQAFSYDERRTWETNWIMEFERPPA